MRPRASQRRSGLLGYGVGTSRNSSAGAKVCEFTQLKPECAGLYPGIRPDAWDGVLNSRTIHHEDRYLYGVGTSWCPGHRDDTRIAARRAVPRQPLLGDRLIPGDHRKTRALGIQQQNAQVADIRLPYRYFGSRGSRDLAVTARQGSRYPVKSSISRSNPEPTSCVWLACPRPSSQWACPVPPKRA